MHVIHENFAALLLQLLHADFADPAHRRLHFGDNCVLFTRPKDFFDALDQPGLLNNNGTDGVLRRLSLGCLLHVNPLGGQRARTWVLILSSFGLSVLLDTAVFGADLCLRTFVGFLGRTASPRVPLFGHALNLLLGGVCC